MRISYSSLESFLTCPAKYKFSEIDKIKSPKSKEALFGTLIHKTLQMMHDPSTLVSPIEEEVLAFFSSSWDKDVYASESEEMTAFEQGVKIIKDYYKRNYPANFHILGLESFFEAPIKDGEEIHSITGKIDRIDKLKDDTFEVIDYKTSRTLPSQKSVDENMQLAMYHLGLLNKWPNLAGKPVKLSLYFLRHGEKLSTIKNTEKLKETTEKILEIIDKIKVSNFAPEINPLCDWCGYQSICPYFSHKFKKETIDDKKIKEIVEEYLGIKERSKKEASRVVELQKLINQYCDEAKIDRIFSDTGYVSRALQERYSYDEKMAKEILKEIGKLEEFLIVDVKKLGKSVESFSRDEKKKINEARTKKEFKVLSAKKTKKK
ncbi:MAG: PD-(D/E)XK nuclease family protein [bacterium]|nr:PD-(D/E)XK nuclease family protein [bacterium]